jgi:DNA-directed RNA polymerase subunit beta
LMVQGMSNEEILKTFYNVVTYTRVDGKQGGWKTPYNADRMKGAKLTYDLVNAATGKVVAEAGTKITGRTARQYADQGLKEILIQDGELVTGYLATDMIDDKKGIVLFEAGHELTEKDVERIHELGVGD